MAKKRKTQQPPDEPQLLEKASGLDERPEILRVLFQGNLEYPATLWVCLHEEFPDAETLAQSSQLVSPEDSARLQRLYARSRPSESQLDAESITRVLKANWSALEFAWELLQEDWPPERWVEAICLLPQWAKDRFFQLLDPEVYPVTVQRDLMRVFGSKEALEEALHEVSPSVAETIRALFAQSEPESGRLEAEAILKILKINWNAPAEYTWFLLQNLGWDQARKAVAMRHLPEWAKARIIACRPQEPLSQLETA